jgi:hypothetical protein
MILLSDERPSEAWKHSDALYNVRKAITHPKSRFHLYVLLWGVGYTAFEIEHTSFYHLFQDLDTQTKIEGKLLNRTVAR